MMANLSKALHDNSIQKVKKVQIVYFSGTGGTARVASSIEKSLNEKGIEVLKASLDIVGNEYHDKPTIYSSIDMLILLFAVHAFDAPGPVYDWIKGIPEGNRLPVAIISVSGGGEVWPNTACRMGCIKLLEKKAYDVFYERMMVMPSNWMVPTKEQLAIRLLQILPSKAEHCVSEVLSGVRRRKKPHIGSRIMTVFFKFEKKEAKRFGSDLQIGSACTGCGWCVRNCPRKNIIMINNKPIFDKKCILCVRCIYGCPSSAIYSKHYSFIPVKEGYNLNELEKRISMIELEPLVKVKAGVWFIGVLKYLHDIEA